VTVLRGSYPAKIDDKGRLKLPSAFKAFVEEQHGTKLYVTSITGDSVLIYPMPVWEEVEQRVERMPSSHPARKKFSKRASYFGQPLEFDAQGRVSISPRLRETAGITVDVDVLGQGNFLEVWNHDRFLSTLQREPFTDDDARALAEFGI
jgi:MraZ protein